MADQAAQQPQQQTQQQSQPEAAPAFEAITTQADFEWRIGGIRKADREKLRAALGERDEARQKLTEAAAEIERLKNGVWRTRSGGAFFFDFLILFSFPFLLFLFLVLHGLRHTQATLLLANGVDIKTVQTRLGHANASITLNWCAHAVPSNDQQAAAIMGSLCARKTAKIIELSTA